MKQALWIIDQLILQGVDHFFVAPGSRSAPLAIAAKKHPKATVELHFDERGLAFYALGFSKASKKPSVIITTSGSAIANIYPALMEAFHSYIPLIVITADRPIELRNCGANQTTNQTHFFSSCIRTQRDLSIDLHENDVRSIIADSVFWAVQNPQGPVHLNCPFREPFDFTLECKEGKSIECVLPKLVTTPYKCTAQKGLLLVGETFEDPKPILDLAKKLKWPIFADILSNLGKYSSPEIFHSIDFLEPHLKKLKPDLIVRFGGRFISKQVNTILECAPHLWVHSFPELQDPYRKLQTRIQSDLSSFCSTFQANTDLNWLDLWQKEYAQILRKLEMGFTKPFTEAHALYHFPRKNVIFFGNSTCIRFADRYFFPSSNKPIFASRGISGIDGNIATIAGLYKALKEPIVAFIGDQTALYDLNSLALLKNKPILLIISNNFGGAIFDYLPVAKTPYLEDLFTAKHTFHFEHAAKMFDIPYEKRTHDLASLPEYGIIELITDKTKTQNFVKNLNEFVNESQ